MLEFKSKGVSRLNNEFIYTIKNKVLTIEKTPDDCITYKMITDIVKNYDFNKVIISEGIMEIGEGSFENTRCIQSVVLPNSLRFIGERAFRCCDGLKYINIPNGVIAIDDFAFKNCTSIKKICIPGSVYMIRKSAFQNCNNLRKVVLKEGVKSIGKETFSNCDKLFDIKLPNSVSYVDEKAFENLLTLGLDHGDLCRCTPILWAWTWFRSSYPPFVVRSDDHCSDSYLDQD